VMIAMIGWPGGRRRDTLYRLLDFTRDVIDDAVRCLEAAGLVVATERTVRGTTALALLEYLRLIGV
jgi:hypothetical protein